MTILLSMRCAALLLLLGLGSAEVPAGAGDAIRSPAATPAVAKLVDVLEREALKVRQVGRSLMVGAALAGKRVVTVGERGSIALSDDGGQTWRQAQRVPVSVTLTAVRFVNERLGWATGHSGVVLHTQDGGETWARQLDGAALAGIALRDAQALAARLGPEAPEAAHALREARLLSQDGADKPLLDLDFSNERHGIVIGAYNLILATADGGQTWQSWMHRTANPKALHLYALARQGDEIYIAGEQGLLLRSTDGGQGFARITMPYQGSWFGVAMQDDRSVIVAGLKGHAYRLSPNGDGPQRLSGGGQATFVNVLNGDAGRSMLVTQSGQFFSLPRNETTLRAMSVPPMPPLAGALPLPGQQLLALTVQGLRRISAKEGAE